MRDCTIVGCGSADHCDREMWKAIVLEATHKSFLDYFNRVCVVPTMWTIVHYPEEFDEDQRG